MKYECVLEVVVADPGVTQDAIDRSLGLVMDALVDMGIEDPFIGGSEEARRYELTVVVEAETELDAFTRGRDLIGKAIELAGAAIGASSPQPSPAAPAFAWSSTSVRSTAVA